MSRPSKLIPSFWIAIGAAYSRLCDALVRVNGAINAYVSAAQQLLVITEAPHGQLGVLDQEPGNVRERLMQKIALQARNAQAHAIAAVKDMQNASADCARTCDQAYNMLLKLPWAPQSVNLEVRLLEFTGGPVSLIRHVEMVHDISTSLWNAALVASKIVDKCKTTHDSTEMLKQLGALSLELDKASDMIAIGRGKLPKRFDKLLM